MAHAIAPQKTMTLGEGGAALAFVALALLSIVVAAKAYTPAYAFHAYLFAAGSIAAVFAIINRYYERPAAHAAADDRGQAQLQYGPGQVRDRRWRVLGGRRLQRRRLYRARTGISGAEFRSAMDQLRPPAAAAHLGGHLRLRRQRADRHVVLCRAAHLPRAARRRSGALVRRARLQFLHRHRRHRLSARHHAVEGICRARMVRRSLADRRLGHLSAGLPRHDLAAHRAAHLRRQLVLSRLHRHHRRAASRQQRRDPGVAVLAEVLHRLVGRAGCDGAVVVRPQRGRLLPHRRLPRDHVLLHSQARASGRSIPTGCRSSTSGR